MNTPAQVAAQTRSVRLRWQTLLSRTVLRLRVAATAAAAVCGLAAAHRAAGEEAAKNPAPQKAVRISGRVIDGAGKPVSGADVTLYQYLQTRVCVGPVRSLKTSTTGAFRFDGLTKNTCLVKVVAPGFAPGFRSQYLEEGQHATLDIRLAKPAQLTLRIHSQAGKALAGATVREITLRGAQRPGLARSAPTRSSASAWGIRVMSCFRLTALFCWPTMSCPGQRFAASNWS